MANKNVKTKKITSIILTLLIVLSSFIVPIGFIAYADTTASGTCGESLTWSLDSDTGILTIEGIGNMDDYHPITNLSPWTDFKESIKSIEIHNGVTSIGHSAFYECTELNSIIIPDSVTSIGGGAFTYCESLTAIDIPEAVTNIGGSAFFGCTELANINIPDGVNAISDDLFSDCISLKSITIPNAVTNIGRQAFNRCTGLTSINIPESVGNIGYNAFCGCNGLESITVSESNSVFHSSGNCLIETESKAMIAGCKNSIIPDDGSVTSINERAFYECSGLTNLVIPDGVTSIGYLAFCGCNGLESITVSEANSVYHSSGNCLIETESKTLIAGCKNSIIPDDGSVTSIGEWAFSDCTGLTSITIPYGVTSIGSFAFRGCSGLTCIIIPDSVTSIGSHAFYECTGLSKLDLGNGLKTISQKAFYGCEKLTEIEIPASVSNIGNGVFYNCTGIETVIYNAESATVQYSESYTLFHEIDDQLWLYGCTELKNVIIGESVLSIPQFAFYNCASIEKIIISDSVQDIGRKSFANCTNVSNIFIGNGIDSIGNSAFYNINPNAVIIYNGTEEEWDQINGSGGDRLLVTYGHEHTFNDVVVGPNCVDSGYTQYECEICLYKYRDNYTAPLGHDTINHEGKASTCKVQGWKPYETCSRCDYTTYEILPLADHTPAEPVKENEAAATCTEGGSYDSVIYCSICGEQISREKADIDPLGHDKVSHEGKASTCKEHGWNEYETCSRCDYTTFEELPFADHTPAEPVKENEVASTHTAYGNYESVIYCTVCGTQISRETVETEPLGHSYSKVVTAPTCTENGYTTYTCSCGDTYTGNWIAPLGHDTINHEGRASTCKVQGWKAYETCSRCDYTTYELLPLADHTPAEPVKENEVASTHNAYGSYESVIYCSVCGTQISRETVETEPLGHSYSKVVTAPTCTDNGYTTYTCSCGDTYKGNWIAPLGHDTITHEGKASTCKEHGWKAYETCSRCDYTTYEILPLADHTPAESVKENEATATCTEGGSYDSVIYCSICGEQISREKVDTDPLGHDKVSHEGKASTCKEHGYNDYETCSRCDYTTYEELPLADHTPSEPVKENEGTATCTEGGSYDSVIYCSICGEQISREKVDTDPIGHDKVSHDGQASTCKEHGWKAYETCSRCDYTTYEELPLGNHTPAEEAVKENEVAATCTAGGSYDSVVKCGVCGDELSREKITTNPTGHNYSSVVTAPTCTERGFTTYTCHCGDSYVDDYVAKLGHSFTNYKYNNDATTEKDGTETAKCDRCTETDTRPKPGTKIVNPTASARLNVKESQTVDYKSNVTVTATATGVPTGYVLAVYEGNTFRTQGDNNKVSYKVGTMTAGKIFTVKVIDPSTKAVQKDSSGAELSKDCEVKVKSGFIDKLIAFFKGLFGSLPNVEVKP